jgi:predicted nucleic acid-binding protein
MLRINHQIFLDTQVFEQELYDTNSPRLKRLKELVEDRRASVLLPEITRREIIARIRETTAKAIRDLTKYRNQRETSILRHVAPLFDPIFATHDSAVLSKIIEDKFDAFCKELDVDHLPNSLTSKSYKSIIDDYFELRPPFQEGRKRSEFPDAFTAAILKKWCDKKKCNITVITNDQDWEGLCTKRLKLVKSLADFLGQFPPPELSKALALALDTNLIRDTIAAEFKNLSFFTDGVDGEVHEVSDVKVTFDHVVIIQADKGEAVAEITCTIQFDAMIEYTIPGSGTWDNEEDTLWFGEKENDQITGWDTVTAEVYFDYNEEDPTEIEDLEDLALDSWDVKINCRELADLY